MLKSLSYLRSHPLAPVRAAKLAVSSRLGLGTNIFSREWDLLVVLDTCRTDALIELQDDYPFLSDIDSIFSVGSSTPEWTAQTFVRDHLKKIQKTAYLTGNGYASEVLAGRVTPESFVHAGFAPTKWRTVNQDDLEYLDNIWEYAAGAQGNPEEGMPSPRVITDRAIQVGRNEAHERLVVHYPQPHFPYIYANPTQVKSNPERYEQEPFEYLRNGGERRNVWRVYLHQLHTVLDEVEMLLRNVTANTAVITADHGEAFGEWGIYGHPTASLHPNVRWVPWVETEGEDRFERTPEQMSDKSNQDINDHLQALGYR